MKHNDIHPFQIIGSWVELRQADLLEGEEEIAKYLIWLANPHERSSFRPPIEWHIQIQDANSVLQIQRRLKISQFLSLGLLNHSASIGSVKSFWPFCAPIKYISAVQLRGAFPISELFTYQTSTQIQKSMDSATILKGNAGVGLGMALVACHVLGLYVVSGPVSGNRGSYDTIINTLQGVSMVTPQHL